MIDNVRLPVDIERGARGGPGFKTTIITMSSGMEQRNIEWSLARGSWNVGYGIRDRDDMDEVYQFFLARRGRGRGFRFKDWLDYSANLQLPVGTDTTRQLVKVYPDDVSPYTRIITLPIADTLVVYVDDFATEDYTLSDGGVLTFDSDPGANVKATFEFDVPARFDTDDLQVELNTFLNGSMPSIPIVELRST